MLHLTVCLITLWEITKFSFNGSYEKKLIGIDYKNKIET